VAAQVVSGIGFLGAGSILLRGDLIRGLTTAASLWTVAAIGLAVGGGLYIEAGAATVIILVILAGIKPIEKWYQTRNQTMTIRLRVDHGEMTVEDLSTALGFPPNRISRYIWMPSADTAYEEFRVTIKRVAAGNMDEMLRKIAALPHVREAEKFSG
jgi:putative Mg2+ transporter-C (MgtC) family protein